MSFRKWIDTLFACYLGTVMVFYTLYGATMLWWQNRLLFAVVATGSPHPPASSPDGWGVVFLLTAFFLFISLLRPDWKGWRRFSVIWMLGITAFLNFVVFAAVLLLGDGLAHLYHWGFLLIAHCVAVAAVYQEAGDLAPRVIISETWQATIALPRAIRRILKRFWKSVSKKPDKTP